MGFHFNPLRKKKVLAPEPDEKTEFDRGLSYSIRDGGSVAENGVHMTYREAAIVALILTLTQIFTTFLPLFDWTKITTNPSAFIFDLIKFAGATFFSIFIVLSGMARYLAK